MHRVLISALAALFVLSSAEAAPKSAPKPPPAKPAAVVPVRGAPATFADLADRLLPMVVNIATSQTLKAVASDPGLPAVPPGSPLADLFKNLMGPNRPQHVTSLGSGFIIDPTGYIVTNNHVIEGADQISVTLNDGSTLIAKLIGRDEKTDLALLKVNPKKPLPFARFGDSDGARIGDWVIAIGNPFGLGSTVTAGIVSARNRDIEAGPYDNYIQTDAPINRGNSGGPLFDMSGNVVGVNSAIYSPSGGSVGIAFSIPSNLVRDVVDQLRRYGQVRRGWIGVRIQQPTQDVAEARGLPSANGALITEVTPSGPAGRGGMAQGDFVVGFDGKPVTDSRSLSRLVADTPIGKTVGVDVYRGGKKIALRLTVQRLAEANAPPPPKQGPAPAPVKGAMLGLSVAAIDDNARARFDIAAFVQGVVVTAVADDSPAGDKNIQPGDVIVTIQDHQIHSPQEVENSIAYARKVGKTMITMLVKRGRDSAYVALPLK